MVKRICGVLVAVVAGVGWGVGNVANATTPPEPDPAPTFRLWAAVEGLELSRVACNVDTVTTCYGVDAAMVTHTATMNPDGTFTIVVPSVAPASTPAAPTTVAAIDPSSGVGTRQNPVPIGTAANLGDGWTLTINSVNLDATAEVAGGNMFNDQPPEGSVYVLINLTASYAGPDEKASPFLFMSGVTSSNVEIDGLDTFVVAPDPTFDSLGEVFAGGSTSGNTVLTVPAAELTSLVLYTSVGFGNNDVYFASQ